MRQDSKPDLNPHKDSLSISNNGVYISRNHQILPHNVQDLSPSHIIEGPNPR